jgi:hypothetical protein
MPFRLLIAGAIGLASTLVALLAFTSVGVNGDRTPVVLSTDHLRLEQGYGQVGTNGLTISAPGAGRQSLVLSRLPSLPARYYASIGWELEGAIQDKSFALIWISNLNAQQAYLLPIPKDKEALGDIDLTSNAAWQGNILALGLLIHGDIDSPVTVRQLKLEPRPFSLTDNLLEILKGWSALEPWSMSSINFRGLSSSNWTSNPLLQIASWTLLSGCLFVWISVRSRARDSWKGAVNLLLLGWLALDLQWQWQLLMRLKDTEADYAGLLASERAQSGLDAGLVDLAKRIEPLISDKRQRIFIITSDPGGYVPLRMRYHLLPHNAYSGLTTLPELEQTAPGDFLLLLAPPDEIRYAPAERLLVHGARVLPADRLLKLSGLDGLYRVRTDR